jgi:hypothetical protein
MFEGKDLKVSPNVHEAASQEECAKLSETSLKKIESLDSISYSKDTEQASAQTFTDIAGGACSVAESIEQPQREAPPILRQMLLAI